MGGLSFAASLFGQAGCNHKVFLCTFHRMREREREREIKKERQKEREGERDLQASFKLLPLKTSQQLVFVRGWCAAVSSRRRRTVVATGFDSKRAQLLQCHFDSQAWRGLPPMPRERLHAALVESADYLFAIGGMILPEEDVGIVDIFDMQVGQWVSSCRGLPMPDMPQPRSEAVACACAGRLYVLGGMQAGPVQTVECFDVWSNSWVTLPDVKEQFSAAGTAVTICV